MLRNIPTILSPELLKILMEMGHNDVIVLTDANYPATSGANRLVRADAASVTDMLDAILQFFPLDSFVKYPVTLMQPEPEDPTPKIWSEFRDIINKRDFIKTFTDFELMERMDYYQFTKDAYAVVQTGTTAHYANIALRKGAF